VQSGEKITKLDDLQDIDELHVVEVRVWLKGNAWNVTETGNKH